MPQAERNLPLHLQVARYYKNLILDGTLRTGDRLPSVRAMREAWTTAPGAPPIGQNVFQRAVEHLGIVEHLVRTDPSGTYVTAPRAAIGPQQRVHLAAAPSSELVSVTSAGLVDAPAYISVILGLEPRGATVIRREELTRQADGAPHMLSVTWCAPEFSVPVPELLAEAALPDPRGAGHLIAERTGLDPDRLSGGLAFECRAAKDDGRELPALGLAPGAYVLAGVSGWRDGEALLEYTEFILPPGQVVEADIEP